MSSTKTSVTKKVYWNVPKFSQTIFTQHETGKRIDSETFSISSGNKLSSEWYFGLRPNGLNEAHKSNVGLYLHCKNAKEIGFDFTAKYKLGVQKDNDEDCFISEEEMVYSRDELKGVGHGDHKFLSHEELFEVKNGYIVGGKLTIFVELKVEVEIAKPPTKSVRSSSSFADFNKMFQNDALSDFQLKTSEGQVLKAHRFALAARSPMFYAMFTTDMEEAKQGSADVPDFSSKVMKELLRYIYCNEVEGLSEIAPELIYAAEKYQLEELKDICLQEITSSVQVGNAVKSLIIGYQVSDAGELFEKCLDLIVNNCCGDVSDEPSWKELPNELLLKIIASLCKQRNILKI